MLDLIDMHDPSHSWQTLKLPLAVLPIGATEQHGPHLPLATDTLEATYFGRVLAARIGAALLPTIPILTSYEHTGYRGTLSFRPETAAAMIRDLADELERQHFTRVVVLNAHGGNFILKPIVRDINRMDRPLKLILVDFWTYDESPVGKRLGKGEIHAGAWETSVMLAIHPELVGDYQSVESPKAMEEAEQTDLTMMGVGVISPEGAWGDPKQASEEAGREIVASIESNLVEAVRERLVWLARESRYGGTGPVALREMTELDVAAGVHLCRLAGWNQKVSDWKLFLDAQPDGCFVAVNNGDVVGTVTTIDYEGKSSWVGMVLVDPEARRQGIGTKLLKAAFEARKECGCIKLDATPTGKKLYDQLGFVDEYPLVRMVCPKVGKVKPSTGYEVQPMTEADLDDVIAFDAKAFGVARPAVIRGLFGMAPEYARVARSLGRELRGFCLGRHGHHYEQIGPVQADGLSMVAEALVASVLSELEGKAAVTDILLHTEAWRRWLEEVGFEGQRSFIRMVRGTNLPGQPALQYCISGPELG